MQYSSIHLLVYLGISSLSYFLITNIEALHQLVPWYATLHARFPILVENGLAVAVVSLIALLFQGSNTISTFIVEKLPISPLLRQLLAGRDFIEGDWPLVVVYGKNSPEPGRLLYTGFLTISYRSNELYVCGNDWADDGVHAQYFESIRSSFQADDKWRLLQYFYRQGETFQDASMRGYTEIYFFPIHKRSDAHAGQFRDAEHNDVRFYARRKIYRLGEARLQSAEAKKVAAKEVWIEFQPNIQAMIAQPISADWR